LAYKPLQYTDIACGNMARSTDRMMTITLKIPSKMLWEIERMVMRKPNLYSSRSDFIRKAIEMLLDVERIIELENSSRQSTNNNGTRFNGMQMISLEECLKMCEEIVDEDRERRRRKIYYCRRMCREYGRPSVKIYTNGFSSVL